MTKLPLGSLLAVLALPSLAVAADEAATVTVALPAARTDGKVAVEWALKQRRSVREFAPGALDLPTVGQLAWAAQGVTDEKGHRTAPSARAKYSLELYLMAGEVTGLPPGLYHYEPALHALRRLATGDRRAEFDRQAVGQPSQAIAKAPATFIIAGSASRIGPEPRDAQWMWVEAGLAAQGFFLEATSMGLGSTYIGGFRPAEAHALLNLPGSEEVLAVLPVGKRP
jgi:SagB-type dehydrogenase family enzyme